MIKCAKRYALRFSETKYIGTFGEIYTRSQFANKWMHETYSSKKDAVARRNHLSAHHNSFKNKDIEVVIIRFSISVIPLL